MIQSLPQDTTGGGEPQQQQQIYQLVPAHQLPQIQLNQMNVVAQQPAQVVTLDGSTVTLKPDPVATPTGLSLGQQQQTILIQQPLPSPVQTTTQEKPKNKHPKPVHKLTQPITTNFIPFTTGACKKEEETPAKNHDTLRKHNTSNFDELNRNNTIMTNMKNRNKNNKYNRNANNTNLSGTQGRVSNRNTFPTNELEDEKKDEFDIDSIGGLTESKTISPGQLQTKVSGSLTILLIHTDIVLMYTLSS